MSGSGINFGGENKRRSTTICWLCGRKRAVHKIAIFRLETCGHVFCRTCLYSQSSGTNRKCPLVNCGQLYKEPVVEAKMAKPIDETQPIYLHEPVITADAFFKFLDRVLAPKPGPSGSGTSKPSTSKPSTSKPSTSKSLQQNAAASSSSSTISKTNALPSFNIPEGYTDACQHCGRIAADINVSIVLLMNCNHVLCRECMNVNKDLNPNLIKRECPFATCRKPIVKVEVLKKSSVHLKESIFDVIERKIKSTELNEKKPLVDQAAAPSAALSTTSINIQVAAAPMMPNQVPAGYPVVPSAAPITSALPVILHQAPKPFMVPNMMPNMMPNQVATGYSVVSSAAPSSVTSPYDNLTPAQYTALFGGNMKSKEEPEIYPVPTPMPRGGYPWDYHLPIFREMPQPIPGTFPPVYAYTPPTNDGLPDSW